MITQRISINRFRGYSAIRDRGLSLTETLLVLGVIALVAVIAYNGYGTAVASVKAGGDTQAVVLLAGNINRTFSTSPDYSGVTTPNLINAGLVPRTFKVRGTTNIIHSNGSDVIVGSAPATNPIQYSIAYTNVPTDQCIEIAQSVSSAFQEVFISNSATAPTPATLQTKPTTGVVKSITAPFFNTSAAIPLCAPGTTARHIIVYGS